MYLPVLAAIGLAAVFTQLGSMSVRIALLNNTVNALILIAMVLAIYILWEKFKE